jgi:hypothetical protein
MPTKGINILFKKIKPVFTILVFKNLKIAGFPLLVLTNWVLLIHFLKLKMIDLILFLNNNKPMTTGLVKNTR